MVRDEDEVDSVDEDCVVPGVLLNAEDIGETTVSSVIGETRRAEEPPGLGLGDRVCLDVAAFFCLASNRLVTAARSLANSTSSGLLTAGDCMSAWELSPVNEATVP